MGKESSAGRKKNLHAKKEKGKVGLGGMKRKEEISACLKEKGKVEAEAEEGRKLCMVKKGKVR